MSCAKNHLNFFRVYICTGLTGATSPPDSPSPLIWGPQVTGFISIDPWSKVQVAMDRRKPMRSSDKVGEGGLDGPFG